MCVPATRRSNHNRSICVVCINETYSKKMGYIENCLPKALAMAGADVHLLTTNLIPGFDRPGYENTYGHFNDGRGDLPRTEFVDNYTVHYLPHRLLLGRPRMVGLWRELAGLKPDIVQCFAAISWIPLDAALAKPWLGYKLFTGNHTHASVFPLAQRKSHFLDRERLRALLLRGLPGRFISSQSEKCYVIAVDSKEVAVRFFGVQEQKVQIAPLGVDTDIFEPFTNDRDETRRQLGFAPNEIVCVYTGRFSPEKNPLVLAKAIEKLVNMGKKYRGLFVGNGAQENDIAKCVGAVHHPFVPHTELARLYRASDIGVWPTQESTSMLDASACGLPIIVNDTVSVTERVEGSGVTYRLNDEGDLVRALLSLQSVERRKQLGSTGATKMARDYSWNTVAKSRMRDYRAALNAR